MRLARICAFVTLMVVLGNSFIETSAAETAQQRQARLNRQKKKNMAKKGTKLPVTNNVPAAPLPVRPLPTGNAGLPGVNTVDKEADFTVDDDATIQQLTKFASGLNYVAAQIGDLKEGVLATLTLKGDKIENVSGTIVKLTDSNKKITLRMTIPSGQTPPEQAGRPCTMVSIRTAVEATEAKKDAEAKK
jgi:hypothetical protein